MTPRPPRPHLENLTHPIETKAGLLRVSVTVLKAHKDVYLSQPNASLKEGPYHNL